MTGDVITQVEGRVGRIRLNRPKALHALTLPMCEAMIAALVEWREHPEIEAVLIDHAEGRGFCAGGDVRAAAAAADAGAAHAFFATEYQLNHLLFTYAKPVVAVMDGVTMGGGVGIALPARYRIATERTVLAMPETTIGLFPDVGGGWYLSRLEGRMGQYLALTGARLDGAEVTALGMATHHVPSDGVEALKAAIVRDPGGLVAHLDGAAVAVPEAVVLQHREAIDRLFAADRFEDVLAALDADGSEWAAAQVDLLRGKSPQACKVALRLLYDSKLLTDFGDEMRMEYGVAFHVCQRPDFAEGVRALLVDKDNAPRWNPETPDGVTEHMIDTIFGPLPAGEEWEPLRR